MTSTLSAETALTASFGPRKPWLHEFGDSLDGLAAAAKELLRLSGLPLTDKRHVQLKLVAD